MKFLSQVNINTEYNLPIVDGINGQVLTTDGNGAVYWGSVTAGANNLDALTDVELTNPTSGQILRYAIPPGGTLPVWYNWTPTFLTGASSISALSDVSTSSNAVGQLLRWTGSTWSNWTPNFLTAEADTLATVTTRGNITTNTIDVGGVKSDYVTLDTTASPTPATGMFSWNTADDTANLQLASGASLQLGQETHWYVKNSTGSTIPNGTVVRAVGTDGVSGHLLVAPMVADGTVEERYILGITTTAIANGGFGHVTDFGKVRGVNTSSFTEGSVLYCSPTTPGALTATEPTSPNLKIAIAFVVTSHAVNGVLAVRVDPGRHLAELHDVNQSSVATGHLLRWNSNRWENWAPNYLTSESDTLATVTGRGATTSTALTLNGNVSVGTSASLSFGSATRQMVNLWSTIYGIGVQSSTQYFRTGGGFAWFLGGVHSNTANDPGTGGTLAMRIDSSSNLIVTGAATASSFTSTGLLIANADTSGGQIPDQGQPANKIYSFRWMNSEQGYIDTDAKITFAGFKTPAGTSAQFLKADGSVDSSTYITSSALSGYATQTWVNANFYNQGNIDDFFFGNEPILGYNKANWDTAYGWGNHAGLYAAVSHNHTSLTGVTSIGFAAQSSDTASITTTISGTSTFFDFNLTDDNNNDWWRWRFTPSGSTVYDAMTLKPLTNGNADLTISGSVFADNLAIANWNTAYGWGDHDGLYASIATEQNLIDLINSLGSAAYEDSTSFATASHTHAIADVTGLQTALNAKAPLASPALTGTPTAPTATAGTNTTQIATTAFVQTAVSNLIDAAPATLDTLNELAAALGDDPNFATTVSNSIGTKVSKSGDTMTGALTLPNAVFTNDASSRVMYLRGTGNIIQFQDASSVNKWEVVGRQGEFYIYKNDGTGSGYRYKIDSNGNHTITGEVSVSSGFTASGNISAANFSGSSSGTNTGDQTTITGNAGSATVLQTARTLTIGATGKTFNGSANVSWSLAEIGAASSTHNHDGVYLGVSDTAVDSDKLGGLASSSYYLASNPSGYITSASNITGTSAGVVRTVTGTTSAELVRGNMGDNDQARILVGATASNAGYLEIATADDGTEPIYVRQYTGVFSTLTRTATLLDGSGNTSFPGTVTAPTFSGALSGNATTATTLQNTRTINGTNFNGSANITTSTWGTARTITIGSTGKSVNGGANVSWTLTEIGAAAASHTHDASEIVSGTFATELIPDLSGTYSLVGHTHDDRYYTETESDARYPLSRGAIGTTLNVGDATGFGNNKASGTYTRSYSGHSGQVWMSHDTGGSVGNFAIEVTYFGSMYIHTNVDSASWSTKQIWTSYNFTQSDINNWNTAYGWGDHDGLYASIATEQNLVDLTNSLGSAAYQDSTAFAAASHTHSISDVTDSTRWWNNFGDNHSTRTSFDATAPSYGFGWRYVQGSTNGPGTSGTQFYSLYVGLGNDYPATGAGSYGMYLAIDRNVDNPYLSVRYNENNSLSSWRKIWAGRADFADSAGTATSATTATTTTGNAGSATVLQTARTLTIGNTGKTFDGGANVSWTLAEIGAQAAGSYLATTGGNLTGNTSVSSGISFLFSGISDTNWRIGRNIITESSNNLTSNTLQFIAAAAAGQGWQFVGSTGITRFEIDASNGKMFFNGTEYDYVGSSVALRSNAEFSFLTRSNAAQKGRFGGIQVSTSYSGTIPNNGILFFTDTTLTRINANELTTNADFVPDAADTYNLGRADARWRTVYCNTLDSAGLHESNLNQDGIADYETGTVLVWKNGEMVPCDTFADHMRMGIAVHGTNSPLMQGAEPVLCTGEVREGQYLVTSEKAGHAVGVDRSYVVENQLFDCVIGKALESRDGESFVVKTWVNI